MCSPVLVRLFTVKPRGLSAVQYAIIRLYSAAERERERGLLRRVELHGRDEGVQRRLRWTAAVIPCMHCSKAFFAQKSGQLALSSLCGFQHRVCL